MGNKASFIFLDIETTGLEPNVHSIVELAAIATDDDFNELSTFSTLIKDRVVVWDTYCILMHTENGLVKALQDGPASTTDIAASRFELWLDKVVDQKNKPQIAGASVHFDVSFLQASGRFDFVKKLTHYRRFDLSVLRTAAKLVGKTDAFAVGKKEGLGGTQHRALSDIRQDIDHARKFKRILAAA